MKKKLLSFSIIMSLVAGAFMMQSCEELKDLAAFDVDKDLPSQYFTLDSASTKDKGEKMLYESSFFVNLDSILEANGVDRGNVSDGRFDQISLSIDNPSPKMQFGFLSKVTFKLSETPDFAVENTIASASNIQVGDTEIVLNINSQNLDNYIELKRFYFRLYGETTGPVPVEYLPLILTSKVRFTVNPLD